MPKKPTDKKLINFAKTVLMLMEEDTEWSGDTMDTISLVAKNLGLAKNGKDGYFKRIKK